jgi:hypothetical protein
MIFCILRRMLLAWMLAMLAGQAAAREDADDDHGVVLEAAPAFERDIKSKSTSYGATAAFEMTPIENWLEMEYGLTLLSPRGRRNLEADVLFKKPYRLSENAEFMIGLGPTFERRFGGSERATAHGLEFALDFMFWRTKSVGWYVEPSYGMGLGGTKGERTIGGSAGLLLRWP